MSGLKPTMKTLIVGRSPHADIVLADDGVARRHLEIVAADGRYFIADCGTETGTWRAVGRQSGEEVWEPVRQVFVHPDQPLRLGQYRTSLNELFARIKPIDQTEAGGHDKGLRRAAKSGSPPSLEGPVERDPRTGQIVRRRI